jgi:hypothetical protein
MRQKYIYKDNLAGHEAVGNRAALYGRRNRKEEIAYGRTGPGKFACGVIRTGVKLLASGNYSNVFGEEEGRNQRRVETPGTRCTCAG